MQEQNLLILCQVIMVHAVSATEVGHVVADANRQDDGQRLAEPCSKRRAVCSSGVLTYK